MEIEFKALLRQALNNTKKTNYEHFVELFEPPSKPSVWSPAARLHSTEEFVSFWEGAESIYHMNNAHEYIRAEEDTRRYLYARYKIVHKNIIGTRGYITAGTAILHHPFGVVDASTPIKEVSLPRDCYMVPNPQESYVSTLVLKTEKESGEVTVDCTYVGEPIKPVPQSFFEDLSKRESGYQRYRPRVMFEDMDPEWEVTIPNFENETVPF